MTSKGCRCLALLGLMAAGAARAIDPTPGFGTSVRVGYGSPLGGIALRAGDGAGTSVTGQLPLQIDVGYRVTPELALAVFGQYAVAWIGSDAGCALQAVSCSARDLRGGVEVLWHFLPGEDLDPWVAAGAGWEWMTVTGGARAGAADRTVDGVEYANVQAGADLALHPRFSVGPYVQLTFASYSSASSTSAAWGPLDTSNAGVHRWLQLGVRGTFGL